MIDSAFLKLDKNINDNYFSEAKDSPDSLVKISQKVLGKWLNNEYIFKLIN